MIKVQTRKENGLDFNQAIFYFKGMFYVYIWCTSTGMWK